MVSFFYAHRGSLFAACSYKKVILAQYCVTAASPYTSTVLAAVPCLASKIPLFMLIAVVSFVRCCNYKMANLVQYCVTA